MSKLIGKKVNLKGTWDGHWGYIKDITDEGYYIIGGGSISCENDSDNYREFDREDFTIPRSKKQLTK